MLRLVLIVLLGSLVASAQTTRAVTVEQLQQILAQQHKAHKSDGSQANQLRSLKLTERLTAPTLERIEQTWKPGEKTELALELLVDDSGFLDPPAAEIPDKPRPTPAEQEAILNAAIRFVAQRLKHLPDFLATRTTSYFNNDSLVANMAGSPVVLLQPLHLASYFSQEITYRNGQEVLKDLHLHTKRHLDGDAIRPRMAAIGDFGDELGTVLSDAAKGNIAWSHWETTPAGLAATFKYRIPAAASHYRVDFCCVRQGSPLDDPLSQANANAYHGTPGYHGEITIDSATGAILRLTIVSDLVSSGPLQHYALWVRYASVKIGESVHVCPVRSSVLTLSRNERWSFGHDTLIQVNDVMYSDYHRFSTTVKIIGNPLAQ